MNQKQIEFVRAKLHDPLYKVTYLGYLVTCTGPTIFYNEIGQKLKWEEVKSTGFAFFKCEYIETEQLVQLET